MIYVCGYVFDLVLIILSNNNSNFVLIIEFIPVTLQVIVGYLW